MSKFAKMHNEKIAATHSETCSVPQLQECVKVHDVAIACWTCVDLSEWDVSASALLSARAGKLKSDSICKVAMLAAQKHADSTAHYVFQPGDTETLKELVLQIKEAVNTLKTLLDIYGDLAW